MRVELFWAGRQLSRDRLHQSLARIIGASGSTAAPSTSRKIAKMREKVTFKKKKKKSKYLTRWHDNLRFASSFCDLFRSYLNKCNYLYLTCLIYLHILLQSSRFYKNPRLLFLSISMPRNLLKNYFISHILFIFYLTFLFISFRYNYRWLYKIWYAISTVKYICLNYFDTCTIIIWQVDVHSDRFRCVSYYAYINPRNIRFRLTRIRRRLRTLEIARESTYWLCGGEFLPRNSRDPLSSARE